MIVVSGATGTIGSEVVRLLVARGLPVRALSRDRSRARQALGPGVEIRQADLEQPETLSAVLDGAAAVLVLTAVSDALAAQERNLVDAATRAGTPHLVKLSAIGAAPDSPMTLGRQHGLSEEHLREQDISWTVLRPTSFMQNLLMHVPSIRSDGRIFAPYGEGRVAFVDTRDIAATAAEILAEPEPHSGEIYTLTGPEPVSHQRVAEAIGAAAGREVSYVPVPPEAAREAMLKVGLPGWLADEHGNPIMEETDVPETYHLLPAGGTREMGGHKGYGLSVMVDILAGVLSGTGPGFLNKGTASHH
ncbi:MAG: Ldh family oxidoreductase, partial [Gemmatimonadota bacterium]